MARKPKKSKYLEPININVPQDTIDAVCKAQSDVGKVLGKLFGFDGTELRKYKEALEHIRDHCEHNHTVSHTKDWSAYADNCPVCISKSVLMPND